MTDEALMQAVRGGDLEALGQLFERHHRPVFRFLSRTTGDATAAEDLVQEVFVRILKYRHTYSRGNRFDAWMFSIARNARADYYRTRTPPADAAAESLEIATTEPGPGTLLEQRIEVERLDRALRQLDEDARDLLALARYEGMPYEQIADLLGIEVGAVKVRVHRAMKRLRALFFELEDAPCAVKK